MTSASLDKPQDGSLSPVPGHQPQAQDAQHQTSVHKDVHDIKAPASTFSSGKLARPPRASQASTPVLSPRPVQCRLRSRVSILASGVRCKQKRSISPRPSSPPHSPSPDARDNPQPIAFQCSLFNMFKALAADEELGRDGNETPMGTETPDTTSSEYESEGATASHTTVATPAATNPPSPTSPSQPRHATSSGDLTIENWLQDTRAEHKAASQRLIAISMSNLATSSQNDTFGSPVKPNDQEVPVKPVHPNLRELLGDDMLKEPASQSSRPSSLRIDTTAERTRTDSSTTDSSEIRTPIDFDDEDQRWIRSEVSEAEKLQVIKDEFGDIASEMVRADGSPGPAEHILAEAQGALFKGVMIIGNLHLTTHRLVFHAVLPPDSAYANTVRPAQTDVEESARESGRDILQAGSVTVHRNGIMKSKKRVWLELSSDMLSTYPSADEAGRVRPLVTVLLSSCHRLAPVDGTRPLDFFITYDASDGQRTAHFSVDNEQSAIQWRRQIEGALFSYARQRFRDAHRTLNEDGTVNSSSGDDWSMLRCCVPLDIAKINGIGSYHSFATLVNLEVPLDRSSQTSTLSEQFAQGYRNDSPSYEDSKRRDHSPARSSTDSTRHRRGLSLRLKRPSRDESPKPSKTPLSGTSVTADTLVQDPKDTASDASPSVSDQDEVRPIAEANAALRSMALQDPSTLSLADPNPEDWVDRQSNTFEFLVAVLNEQKWFAQALEAAVQASHKRRYKPDVQPPKMVLDVSGYDCLAHDDAIERNEDKTPGVEDGSPSTPIDEDEDSGKPAAVIATRKAEKAAMAAKVFGLRADEGIWLKRCYYVSSYGLVPLRGHMIVTPRYVCFWRRATVGSDVKFRFSTSDVKGAEKVPAIKIGRHNMALKVHGRHDLRFEFWSEDSCLETIKRINSVASTPSPASSLSPVTSRFEFEKPLSPVDSPTSSLRREASVSSNGDESSSTITSAVEREFEGLTPIERARETAMASSTFQINPTLVREGKDRGIREAVNVLAPPRDMMFSSKTLSDAALSYMPFVANRPLQNGSGYNIRLTPRHFAMLTIGSRGDVQPYIALGLRLMKDGHRVTIVTHDEFKKWIESYGIGFREAGGDPTALMKLANGHRMFSPGFFKVALVQFRSWLDDLLRDSYEACKDADVLIESPSAMAGVHIAEALNIPYFRAFTMPWTPTMAYPQAFMVPSIEMGPSFNYSTYVLFDQIMWRATAGQINKWRKNHLGLKATNQSSLSISKVPFLYNFSPAVVPKPLDWHDNITITGYWTLEDSDRDWSAPDSLLAFMEQAREDGKPLVYIGFGSIVVPDPTRMTKSIIKAVRKADVRAIIAKGWSARSGENGKETEEEVVELPPDICYGVDKVPHGWLFPKIQAALHHGGAGTVGASLRAGIPTLIKPWFGDQFFWAQRVQKLEVGVRVSSLSSGDIADALKKATTSTVMIEKAARIGERIRSEHGTDTAVATINQFILRAARSRDQSNKMRSVADMKDEESEKAASMIGSTAPLEHTICAL